MAERRRHPPLYPALVAALALGVAASGNGRDGAAGGMARGTLSQGGVP